MFDGVVPPAPARVPRRRGDRALHDVGARVERRQHLLEPARRRETVVVGDRDERRARMGEPGVPAAARTAVGRRAGPRVPGTGSATSPDSRSHVSSPDPLSTTTTSKRSRSSVCASNAATRPGRNSGRRYVLTTTVISGTSPLQRGLAASSLQRGCPHRIARRPCTVDRRAHVTGRSRSPRPKHPPHSLPAGSRPRDSCSPSSARRRGAAVGAGRRRRARPPPTSTAGSQSIDAERTGRFRVERIDGVWWFVDPDGHGFFSSASNNVNIAADFSLPAGSSPYLDARSTATAPPPTWAAATRRRLRLGASTPSAASASPPSSRGACPTRCCWTSRSTRRSSAEPTPSADTRARLPRTLVRHRGPGAYARGRGVELRRRPVVHRCLHRQRAVLGPERAPGDGASCAYTPTVPGANTKTAVAALPRTPVLR